MIRIKAPRVWAFRGDGGWYAEPERTVKQDVASRLYTESMHRRVVALVRACERQNTSFASNVEIGERLEALRAQAEKEAK